MGIPSLNSAILYCVSLYFHISSQETSRHHANITNIPDLVQENWRIVHENGGFYGYAHQNEPSVHKKASFCGRDMTIQSGPISKIPARNLINAYVNNVLFILHSCYSACYFFRVVDENLTMIHALEDFNLCIRI